MGVLPRHRRHDMKSWKAALGVGLACTACCALPVLGSASALTAGSVALASVGSAFVACTGEFVPLALIAALVAGVGAWQWRQRKQRSTVDVSSGSCACGETTDVAPACRLLSRLQSQPTEHTDAVAHQPTSPIPASGQDMAPSKSCGCSPGTCA